MASSLAGTLTRVSVPWRPKALESLGCLPPRPGRQARVNIPPLTLGRPRKWTLRAATSAVTTQSALPPPPSRKLIHSSCCKSKPPFPRNTVGHSARLVRAGVRTLIEQSCLEMWLYGS